MSTLHVAYSKKVSPAGSFSSESASAALDFEIPETANVQHEWTAAYAMLRSIVEPALAIVEKGGPATPDPAAPAAPATANLSQATAIVPKAPVQYLGVVVDGKVFHNKPGERGEHTKVSISAGPNTQGLPQIPAGTNMKCFDKPLIPSTLKLTKGDVINVKGYYDDEYPKGSGKHDFRVQELTGAA